MTRGRGVTGIGWVIEIKIPASAGMTEVRGVTGVGCEIEIKIPAFAGMTEGLRE